MKSRANTHLRLYLLCIVMYALWSCSQESNTLVSKAYHNTTAHYNAYYLAREKMKLIEIGIEESQQYDYNVFLPIFPTVDTNYSKGIAAETEYVLERASLPVQKHKNSKWVDDSYLLVGKAWEYDSKIENAIKTYKYVLTKGPDKNTRHKALIMLMKVYVNEKLDRYAKQSYDYLLQQKMTKKNQKDFHLVSAYYFMYLEEHRKALDHLEQAIPLIKKRDEKSKTLFIAAQLRQYFNEEEESFKHYKNVLKKNPPYELSFFTKLYLAQVTQVNDQSEVHKIEKYFKKLLKDPKNEEFKNKIYHEMARFEQKRGLENDAIVLYNKSLRAEGQNPVQKNYTYLELGKIYYKRKDYVNAKLYYDSTVVGLPENFKNFEFITERQLILEDFVEQYLTVKHEDSLQALARMDPDELSALLDKKAAEEETKLKEEAKKQLELEKKQARDQARNEFAAATGLNQGTAFNQNSNFTFYNQAALGLAFSKFREKWGDRKLEDNWRRSRKMSDFAEGVDSLDTTDSLTAEQKEMAKIEENFNKKKKEIENIKVDKSKYYDDIPFDEAAITASNEKIESALYRMGKIYSQQLNEPEEAIVTFQRLQKDFPNHEFYAEVDYFLYLLCENSTSCNKEVYSEEIFRIYPNSIYARLIENPNYLRDYKSNNKLAHESYETAYDLYYQRRFIECKKVIDNINEKYPKNDIKDKLDILKAICYAGTDNYVQYFSTLENFLVDHKTSDLIPFAESLLEQRETHFNNQVLQLDTVFAVNKMDSVFYFIANFKNIELEPKEAINHIYEFHKTYLKDKEFSTRHIQLLEDRYIIVVRSVGLIEGKEYIAKRNHFDEFKEHYTKFKYDYVLITPKNYNVLQNNKNIDEYIQFYRRNYK